MKLPKESNYQEEREIDQETGLIYFGKRYYDPEIGRWISPDPAGNIDGPNLYAFATITPSLMSIILA